MKQTKGWLSACLMVLIISPSLAETVPLTDLARHFQYDKVRISDDGHHLAATAVVKGKPVLVLLDLTTKKGATIHPRDGNQIVDLWWVNDQRVLYTEGTKVSGFDRPFSTGEIFGVDADGSHPQLLFGYRAGSTYGTAVQQEPERASGRLIDTMPDDKDHVLIGVDSWEAGKDGDFTKLYVMDVRNGIKRSAGVAPIRNADFVADHKGVARFAVGSDNHAYPVVYYRQNDGDSWRLLYQGTLEKTVPMPQGFSRDDNQVYMSCQAPGKAAALCRWDVTSQAMGSPIWSSVIVDATDYVASLDGRDIVGVYSMPGLPTTEAITPDADSIKAIGKASRQLPGESVRIVSSSKDGKKAVMLASSDMDPGTFYLWDVDTEKLTPLLERSAWINPPRMAATTPIEFKARDGLTIHGYLSLPPGKEQTKGLPLVVYVHGGPFGVRDDWGYDPYVQMMATRGYAVLQVNFRGSGGYGSDFLRAGYREWGGKMQDDLTDATHWAVDQGIASPERICIFGGSYGGYAALEGAMKEPGLYRCAIGYVGVYDLAKMYTDGDASKSTVGKAYWRTTLGTDPSQLATRSPINQLDSLKARVMLIVGGEDTRVPPIQGQSLHVALQNRGIAHEWLYRPKESHGFYDEANIADLFDRVTGFLDHNIGNGMEGTTALPQ